MADGEIYRLAEQFRRELLTRERGAASELVRLYGEVWKRIKARIDELLRQIQEARAAGEEVSPAWLFQERRLQALKDQLEAELREFARYAEARVVAEQAEAVAAAERHAEQLTLAGLGEPPPGVVLQWSRLPHETVQTMIGFLQDGSPLRALLEELGPEVAEGVGRALVSGVALGLNPRETARLIRKEFGMGMVRALRIARTETLRAYREAERQSYLANREVVKGWIWHSAADAKTCPMCWAMHGTKHSLEERLNDHPNGRCAMLPWTATWEELGLSGVPETRVEVERGEDLFAQQPEEVQRAVLGKAGYEAWRAGAVRLADFVGRRRTKAWGTTRYARSLREVLGWEGANRWMQKAKG